MRYGLKFDARRVASVSSSTESAWIVVTGLLTLALAPLLSRLFTAVATRLSVNVLKRPLDVFVPEAGLRRGFLVFYLILGSAILLVGAVGFITW